MPITVTITQFSGGVTEVPQNGTLAATSNYLLALCSPYSFKAASMSGSGGSVSPISPQPSPNRLDFYVGSDTPIATGENVVFFPQFVGYNLEFNRGNQPQMTVSDGASTYFSWNKFTGRFECFGAASEGEPFSLIPTS